MRTTLLVSGLVVAASLALPTGSALADPTKATNVVTFTRTCGDDVYTTFKAGRGAAFIQGSDQKFVNLKDGASAGANDTYECDYVIVGTDIGGHHTSMIVGGGK